MGFRYSFTSVRVEISRGQEEIASFGENKSMVGSVTFSRNTERFDAAGDATGGYVINETLDATGEVVISIRQFAPLVASLTNIFNSYDNGGAFAADSENQGAVDIKIFYRNKLMGSAKGCFLNMPEFPFEEEASDRDFTFVSGEVNFEPIPQLAQIV